VVLSWASLTSRWLVQRLQLGDGIQRKVAQALALVAPGIQVPVVAVVHQAQGRDIALGGVAVAARSIGNVQALALGQGGGHLLKVAGPHAALCQLDDAHTLAQLGGLGIAFWPQQGVQAFHQRGDVGGQNAACVQPGQQLLHGQQGVDFGG
jgi:hypothetical protein